MRQRFIVLAILLLLLSAPARAQVPHIVGTWTLNVEASELLGPPPRSEVRRYSVTEDGYLIGLAVIVDAQGNPEFLQFAARSDGQDSPEYSSSVLAALQIAGTPTPLAYSEKGVDERTIEWFDKYDGNVYASGTRQVSDDGQTLTILGAFRGGQGEASRFRYVYDKQ